MYLCLQKTWTLDVAWSLPCSIKLSGGRKRKRSSLPLSYRDVVECAGIILIKVLTNCPCKKEEAKILLSVAPRLGLVMTSILKTFCSNLKRLNFVKEGSEGAAESMVMGINNKPAPYLYTMPCSQHEADWVPLSQSWTLIRVHSWDIILKMVCSNCAIKFCVMFCPPALFVNYNYTCGCGPLLRMAGILVPFGNW